MVSRFLLRTTLGIVLCLAISSSGFGQGACGGTMPTSGCGGSHATAVVLVVAGVAAVAAILYSMHHKPRKNQTINQTINQASIVGCVEKTDAGVRLKNEKDHQTYGIIADTVDLKPGERVELTGNKFKDRDGKLNMDVQNLVMDYGPCTP